MSVLKMPETGKKSVMPTSSFFSAANWLEQGDYMKSIEHVQQTVVVAVNTRNRIIQPNALRSLQRRINNKIQNPGPDHNRYQDGVDLLHEEIRQLIWPVAEACNARIYHAELFDQSLGVIGLLILTNQSALPDDKELIALSNRFEEFAE